MRNSRTMADNYIQGSMVLLCLAEAAHLITMFLKLSFLHCILILSAFWILFFIGFAIMMIAHYTVSKKEKVDSDLSMFRFFKVYPGLFVLIGGLILFQIVWNFVVHMPNTAADITAEEVQSIMAANALYTTNPLTGLPFTDGMPLRLRILCLPTMYAYICTLTGIPAYVFVYCIAPAVTLLLSYTVFAGWAAYLFPKEGKKQILFMLFVSIILQFGCYSRFMDGALLFFRGWQGEAICACVLLPYTLLSTLKKDWIGMALSVLAEVGIVWTLYGFGYCILTVALVLLIRGAVFLFEKRRARE